MSSALRANPWLASAAIHWVGSSNDYYSESVYFAEL